MRCWTMASSSSAAQGIHAREDVRDVLPQGVERQLLAVVSQIVRAVAAHDHQHAPAGRAAVGLEDEVVAAGEHLFQVAEHAVGADGDIDLGRGHADGATQGVHAQLVVNEGEFGAWVVVEDAGGVAPVHAQDAQLAQPACGPK
jgi:hypothetical protein